MSKPIIVIHNAKTNEINEREMNSEELAQWEKDKAEAEARIEAEVQAATAKSAAEAKLLALGLSVDDLKALGL
jgi:ribosome-binding ATPase YchF (GTP1/OBG family)